MANDFYAEGNNGGDTLEIGLLPDGRILLIVGHCCVREIHHVVPVEFVTALLTKAVLDAGGVKEAMKTITWHETFISELVEKIQTEVEWRKW